MAEKPVYVQLEAGDDIATVRDRLSFIRGRRVLLIWPEQGTTLTRKLDLVMIQRESRRRATQIAFVTHDETVIEHAKELEISTFATLDEAEKRRWQRGRSRVFVQRFHRPEDEPEPEELMEVASRVRTPRKMMSRTRYLITRLATLLLIIGLVFGVVYLIVPGAEIRLTLQEQTLQAQNVITADPNRTEIDITNGIIPATILQANVETTGTISTTGNQNLDSVPSVGTVVFTNRTNGEVSVPLGTVVHTSTGNPVFFRTLETANIDAGEGQRVEVGIEAMQDSRGEIGNVDAGLINTIVGPLESQVNVLNTSPTSGGEFRSLPTVTQDDYARILNSIRGELQGIAYTEMQLNLNPTQFVVVETIQIALERDDWKTYSHTVDEITDNLSLTMRAIVEAVAIDRRLGQQITLARLSAQIPEGYALVPDSIFYSQGGFVGFDEFQRVLLDNSGEGRIIASIDTDSLKARLRGKTIDEALQILQTEVPLAEGSTVEVRIEPHWMTRFPFLDSRIEIIIENET